MNGINTIWGGHSNNMTNNMEQEIMTQCDKCGELNLEENIKETDNGVFWCISCCADFVEDMKRSLQKGDD